MSRERSAEQMRSRAEFLVGRNVIALPDPPSYRLFQRIGGLGQGIAGIVALGDRGDQETGWIRLGATAIFSRLEAASHCFASS